MSKENSRVEKTELVKRLEQMRTLVDDCLAELSVSKTKSPKARPGRTQTTRDIKPIDFSVQVKAIVKRYARRMSGPEKFTLLVAWLTKGDQKVEVPLNAVVALWNKMTARDLLGGKFNHFYPNQAKTNDWVESKKTGKYSLRPSWKEILKA